MAKCCRHEQQLHEIEGDLTEMLTVAREQVVRCEWALAMLREVLRDITMEERDALQHTEAGLRPLQRRINRSNERVTCPEHGGTRHQYLTARETDVLQLIAIGRSNREIAEALFLSPRTVERHIANIYLKIDAHSRAVATAYAFRHGLIEEPAT